MAENNRKGTWFHQHGHFVFIGGFLFLLVFALMTKGC